MHKLKSNIIGLTVFFVPLFFLPITHEFYSINKLMLLIIASISLLSISTYQFIKTKEIRWSKNSLRLLIPIFAFLMAVSLSTVIASTNKVQAALNLSYGPVILAVLMVFYWYLSQEENSVTVSLMIRLSAFCMSIITLILLLHPFDNVALPKTFQFLKNQSFSPIGTQLDLMLFLGFASIYQLLHSLKIRRQTRQIDWLTVLGLTFSTLALFLFFLGSMSRSTTGPVRSVPTLDLSFKTMVRSLSTPSGFIFGSGTNNFGTIFTLVKDSSYNASQDWTVSSYDNANSVVLQVVTESGILGILALIWLFIAAFTLDRSVGSKILLGYMAFTLLVVPASMMVFFFLFCALGITASSSSNNRKHTVQISGNKHILVVRFANVSFLITLILLLVFALVPTYRAELAMRSSVDAIASGDLDKLYANQYRAVVLNPYIERYRLNFSQTNLFVARQMATQPKPNQAIITFSVQQAVSEAQAAIALNPRKASNYENLGIIYKNILGVKGAGQWAVAAFQRAIMLDPQNVSYRLELGGIYYSLKQYENAIRTFRDATLLKSDLPNSHYNLAHSLYQNRNSEDAVKVMDALLILLKKQSSTNYEKVLKERNDFASGAPQNQAPTVIQ